MAFNIDAYEEEEIRALPVVLLLDTSGSMLGKLGNATKIDKLNEAVKEMMGLFQKECEMENFIKVTVYAFGTDVRLIGKEQSDPAEFLRNFTPIKAQGMTYLGLALNKAKELIDDKKRTPGRWYSPAVVLVSDGAPNGTWKTPMKDFLNKGRTVKTQRFAIAIGAEGAREKEILTYFTGMPENVLYAEDAADIVEKFKRVTMSVSQRIRSVNPNVFCGPEPMQNTEDDDDQIPFLPPRRRHLSPEKSRRLTRRVEIEDKDDEWN